MPTGMHRMDPTRLRIWPHGAAIYQAFDRIRLPRPRRANLQSTHLNLLANDHEFGVPRSGCGAILLPPGCEPPLRRRQHP
jgi:hypothetical protein